MDADAHRPVIAEDHREGIVDLGRGGIVDAERWRIARRQFRWRQWRRQLGKGESAREVRQQKSLPVIFQTRLDGAAATAARTTERLVSAQASDKALNSRLFLSGLCASSNTLARKACGNSPRTSCATHRRAGRLRAPCAPGQAWPPPGFLPALPCSGLCPSSGNRLAPDAMPARWQPLAHPACDRNSPAPAPRSRTRHHPPLPESRSSSSRNARAPSITWVGVGAG